MDTVPEAREITLASLHPKAPPFHRFIVKRKLLGNTWQAGDKALIYLITATTPPGRVRVTEQTVIQFSDS